MIGDSNTSTVDKSVAFYFRRDRDIAAARRGFEDYAVPPMRRDASIRSRFSFFPLSRHQGVYARLRRAMGKFVGRAKRPPKPAFGRSRTRARRNLRGRDGTR